MKKELDYYLKATYPFIVKPDLDDGGYIVEFSDLRYCIGTGNTTEDAIKDAMIAKEEWIRAAYEDNISIPEPGCNEDYNGRISLRIPKSLHKSIAESAKKEGVSANQFISHLISLGMGKRTKQS